ncbi:MAG: hypothetical protein ACRCT8_12265 [Lacipirellulaceae bacterium]
MRPTHAIVAPFKLLENADAATHELLRIGIDPGCVSLIAKEYHTEEHAVGCYDVGHGMQLWGRRGALWGDVWGSLCGSAFLVLPGIGPVLAAGPLVAEVIACLKRPLVLGGGTALVDALENMGVPSINLRRCVSLLKSGSVLLVVHGKHAEVERAAASLTPRPVVAAAASFGDRRL